MRLPIEPEQRLTSTVEIALKSSGTAIFSPNKLYRYILTRSWNKDLKRTINFLLCNPSIATESILDPTVRKCLVWSAMWGFGEMIVTNIFAYRSTKVKYVFKIDNPIGEDNDTHIVQTFSKSDLVVCGWGAKTNTKHKTRHNQILELAKSTNTKLHYLRLTKNGYPEHPLYLRNTLTPIEWNYA